MNKNLPSIPHHRSMVDLNVNGRMRKRERELCVHKVLYIQALMTAIKDQLPCFISQHHAHFNMFFKLVHALNELLVETQNESTFL